MSPSTVKEVHRMLWTMEPLFGNRSVTCSTTVVGVPYNMPEEKLPIVRQASVLWYTQKGLYVRGVLCAHLWEKVSNLLNRCLAAH